MDSRATVEMGSAGLVRAWPWWEEPEEVSRMMKLPGGTSLLDEGARQEMARVI